MCGFPKLINVPIFLTLSNASGKFCETQNNLQKELNLRMTDHKSKADFNAMSVAELQKYLQERGISASGYLRTSIVEITYAVEKMVLPVDPKFEKAKPLL